MSVSVSYSEDLMLDTLVSKIAHCSLKRELMLMNHCK